MSKNKLKKIVIMIPSLDVAGAEKMVAQLAEGLKKEAVNLTIICFYHRESSITKELEKNKISLIYLNKREGVDIRIIAKLWKILKNIRPDIVHTHLNTLIYAVLPSILLNIPLVHTIHNIADKELPWFSCEIHKILFKKKKAIPVAISPKIKESIVSFYNIKKSYVPMIYNGIDLSKCLPKENQSINVNSILHIGRFSFQKNHIMLINAFEKIAKKHKNIKLFLCGKGELEEEIKKEVIKREISEQVVFLGVIDNVFEILNNADIFVLPSRYEGFPITIIEAMGTGIPIIASNVGGINDVIVDGKNGILCDNNSNDFENKLNECIENYELRKKIGYNALLTSQEFSLERMTCSYLKLYEKIIKK